MLSPVGVQFGAVVPGIIRQDQFPYAGMAADAAKLFIKDQL